jgi:hypothetical protein
MRNRRYFDAFPRYFQGREARECAHVMMKFEIVIPKGRQREEGDRRPDPFSVVFSFKLTSMTHHYDILERNSA